MFVGNRFHFETDGLFWASPNKHPADVLKKTWSSSHLGFTWGKVKVLVDHLCWESSLVFGKCTKHCVAIIPLFKKYFFWGGNLALAMNLHNGSHDLRQRSGIWWKSSVDLCRFDVGASNGAAVPCLGPGGCCDLLKGSKLDIRSWRSWRQSIRQQKVLIPQGAVPWELKKGRLAGRNAWPFDGLFMSVHKEPLGVPMYRTGCVMQFWVSSPLIPCICTVLRHCPHSPTTQSARPQGAWLHGRPHLVLGDGCISQSAAGMGPLWRFFTLLEKKTVGIPLAEETLVDRYSHALDGELQVTQPMFVGCGSWFLHIFTGSAVLPSYPSSPPLLLHAEGKRPERSWKPALCVDVFAERAQAAKMSESAGEEEMISQYERLGSWNFQDVKHIQTLPFGTLT